MEFPGLLSLKPDASLCYALLFLHSYAVFYYFFELWVDQYDVDRWPYTRVVFRLELDLSCDEASCSITHLD